MMVGQWFFLFNHAVFALIYISAIVRFNKKKSAYKAFTEEQKHEIEQLSAMLEEAILERGKVLSRREKQLREIAAHFERQAARNHRASVEILDVLGRPSAKADPLELFRNSVFYSHKKNA